MRAIVGVQVVAGGRGRRPRRARRLDRALRHRVGYVTQAPSVYADLSVGENLSYFASVLGAPSSDVARVVGEVGLGDAASR